MLRMRFLFILLVFMKMQFTTVLAQDIVSGRVNYDVKIYKILLKELKAAERLEKSEPNTTNLFRVFTTRIEILKFLKTKNVEDSLKTPNSSQALVQKQYQP